VGPVNILIAAFIAIGFAGWPIIGRYSQASGGWLSAIVMGVSMTIALLMSNKQLSHGFPTGKALIFLLIAAAINGFAMWGFSAKVSDPIIPVAAFMVIVYILMVAVTPCFDWLFNGATPNINQIIGFVLAGGAIYFLSK